MALVLPYPDLDFVPLDILTAEEMNQIVANYTHIANQFPITSQNIDFTTYTTTEQRVGTWLDGKPIYRKVITSTTFVPSSGYYPIGANIAQFIRQSGYVQRKEYPGIWQAIASRPSSNLSVAWGASNTAEGVQLDWGSGWGDGSTSFGKLVMIVEYTKTTD